MSKNLNSMQWIPIAVKSQHCSSTPINKDFSHFQTYGRLLVVLDLDHIIKDRLLVKRLARFLPFLWGILFWWLVMFVSSFPIQRSLILLHICFLVYFYQQYDFISSQRIQQEENKCFCSTLHSSHEHATIFL